MIVFLDPILLVVRPRVPGPLLGPRLELDVPEPHVGPGTPGALEEVEILRVCLRGLRVLLNTEDEQAVQHRAVSQHYQNILSIHLNKAVRSQNCVKVAIVCSLQ